VIDQDPAHDLCRDPKEMRSIVPIDLALVDAGTQSAGDENGFGPFQGTLTITGGTGRFRHASGGLNFTAVAAPASVGATTSPTSNGMAFYLVQGNMVSPETH
jgi:hypothetical protein